MGAAWNDYAEYRKSDVVEPGYVVVENGDGTLSLSSERLQRGAEIISDTFGFAIGETEECRTPIAVAGRVLAHYCGDIKDFKPGFPVCSGPDGAEDFWGKEMDYEQAIQLCELKGLRLPTLKEINELDFSGFSGFVNISSTGCYWNTIAKSHNIIFPVGADIWVSDEEDDDEYATIVGFRLYDIRREYYSLHTASVRIETKKVKKTERHYLHPILK